MHSTDNASRFGPRTQFCINSFHRSRETCRFAGAAGWPSRGRSTTGTFGVDRVDVGVVEVGFGAEQ